MDKTRKNVFDVVNGRILALLEKGIIPWKKSWTESRPYSWKTGKPYSGLNVFLVDSELFESNCWITYNQARAAGGHVKAGEKGCPIVYASLVSKQIKDPVTKEITESSYRLLKWYTVFNVDQCEGVPLKEKDSNQNPRIVNAEELMNLRSPIIKQSTKGNYYERISDTIHLRPIGAFSSSNSFYSVGFHELTHWTGAKGRCNRPTLENYRESNNTRGLEELIAELGAAYLCQIAEINNKETDEDTVGYIQAWKKAITDNPKWFISASREAKMAVDFILENKIPNRKAEA
jgi:antirestriction protein ArdC